MKLFSLQPLVHIRRTLQVPSFCFGNTIGPSLFVPVVTKSERERYVKMLENLFTEKEQLALQLFRAKISDVISTMDSLESHDANLVRWLRARDLDVDRAEEMLRKSLKWRQENNIDELSKDAIFDEYLQENMQLKPGGRDREGALVMVCPFGRWDLKALLEEGYEEKMFRHCFKFLEIFSKHLQSVDPENIQTQVVMVFDYEQFSLKQVLSQQAIRFTMEFFRLFDANYPERMKAAYIVNAPKLFEMFWPMVNTILSARTISKVHVFGGSPDQWRSRLRDIIDANQLPSDVGGSNTTQHFISNRLGLSIFTIPRAPRYPSNAFTAFEISAGQKFTRYFDLAAGNRITWNFRTDSYDIGFEFALNGKRLFPYAKVDSHICVQDGLVDIIQGGTYTLVFDNSFSRYRSKRLLYVIFVDDRNVSK